MRRRSRPGRSSAFRVRLLVAGLGALAAASPLRAQEADSLRASFRLPVPVPWSPPAAPRSAPAMGANSPSAFGASWGDVFAGAGYTARARDVAFPDGAVAVGFGLGNPWTLAGLEVAVTSFTTLRSGWGKRMGVDFKLHRLFPGSVGVAVGWESAIKRGEMDSPPAHYAVVSKWVQLRESDAAPLSALSLSLGVGTGRFRPVHDLAGERHPVSPFGSVALRVAAPLSVIADWTGQDLVLAASVAPLPRIPLILTPGLADLTGRAGDGVRFVLAGSYSARFTRDP